MSEFDRARVSHEQPCPSSAAQRWTSPAADCWQIIAPCSTCSTDSGWPQTVANMPPTNGMHPIAIATPLTAPVAMVVAFWLALAGGELYLIMAVTTLTVIILLGLITACDAFAHKVEPNGSRTRTFREFLNGEVEVETGRISGRVAFRQIATIPVVVTFGGTLILACAAATHG